jgi:hypothetical protein
MVGYANRWLEEDEREYDYTNLLMSIIELEPELA